MTFVILSPHRDDAAFSLGLSIEAWLGAGHSVSVLNCFTQSFFAPFSDVEALHANDKTSFVSALRRREDQAWKKLLGERLQFHDLDLLDAPLRLGCSPAEVLIVDLRLGDRALSRVAGAIAKIAGRLAKGGVCFLAPLALSGHVDHRVVREAALQALSFAEAPPLAFYEDLPYAARKGEADRVAAAAAALERALAPAFASPPREDVEPFVERKARFCECYDSQIDSEDVCSIAEFCRRYGGRERIWAETARQVADLELSGEAAPSL